MACAPVVFIYVQSMYTGMYILVYVFHDYRMWYLLYTMQATVSIQLVGFIYTVYLVLRMYLSCEKRQQ